MRWLVLFGLIAITVADLPSCSRARCLHCEVEFIARMCPEVCSRCPGKAQSPLIQTMNTIQRDKKETLVYRQPPPVVVQAPQRREAPQPPPVQLAPPPRPQQPLQQQFLPSQSAPPQAQFAAPNAQVQPILTAHIQPPKPQTQGAYQPLYAQVQGQQQAYQPVQYQQQYQQYPQYQQVVVTQPPPPPAVTPSREQAVTLAPLIRMPSAEEINQQLVAQQRLLSNGLYSQVPQAPQAPDPLGPVGAQQPPPQPQQPSSQNSLFSGLFPSQQQQQQQQNTSPFFNPFQPFLQNLGLAPPSSASNTNPFGLPTFPPHPFFTTPAPVAQPQYNQPSYYGVNGQRPQSPYGIQPQQQQQQQQQQQSQQQAQYQTYQQQVDQTKALNTNSIQQPANYGQGNQVAVVARSIDSSPQTYEKSYYAGVAKPQVQYPQCPRQPGWQPCISKSEANQRFANCCARLGEGCMPLCNYDANLATMQLNVLTGRCPLQKVHDIMICASGYKDVTQCCEAYNVFEPGFEHCRPYCNPAGGLPDGGLLSEKYKCLGKLSYIQQCFYVSQNP